MTYDSESRCGEMINVVRLKTWRKGRGQVAPNVPEALPRGLVASATLRLPSVLTLRKWCVCPCWKHFWGPWFLFVLIRSRGLKGQIRCEYSPIGWQPQRADKSQPLVQDQHGTREGNWKIKHFVYTDSLPKSPFGKTITQNTGNPGDFWEVVQRIEQRPGSESLKPANFLA